MLSYTSEQLEKNVKTQFKMEIAKKSKIYYYFKENEKKFSQAKALIISDATYNLFFDGGSSGNPGQVSL